MGDANVKGLLSGAWLGHCWQRLLHFLYRIGQCCCQWKVRKGGERTGILCLLSSTSLERSVTLSDQTGSLSTASALPTWPWLWRQKHTGGGHSKRHLKYNFQCSRGHTPPSYFPSALLVQMKQFWNSETKELIHLINNKMGFQEMWRVVNFTDSEHEV